ncbi:prolyl oligopeptidase family serine peptidase [Sphingobium sp. HBC34]|uniref:Prolyl oligopeptidase family serine peptidase n=1 Tax=Sphingobium cyanobacteriorum TaxID=3063954 RepID=A0ABT8ZNP0_9SPHN|nr:alpha/beta hydrolase [Sphingobium sp. HBC34]MDO7836149.1 prolyl oligopeptidase family serine peptidase [Sphingobium sp. HBC34]
MFEPFPGNYVWNLATNLALVCGGNHGEIDEANRPIMEAARKGADEGSALMFDSWLRVADQVAANAAADEAAGRTLSAGTKYLRASGYYLAAERMQSRDYAPRWAAYDRGLELYAKGVALRGLHVDFVEIPYGDSAYPGIFVHDGSGTPRPTLVSVNGLDSMKEQVNMGGHGAANLERGINTLFVDQPGTGEALRKRGLTAVYDAERWGSPAFDYLTTRPDVIPTRIGIFGLSFGGYHAPRIAANDPRYALCAVMGANHVWGRRQRERVANEGENPVPHYWDHVMWVFGFDDRDAFLDYADQITLDGQVEKIRVPFLITHGENDRQIPAYNAQLSYDQAVNSSKRSLRLFTKKDFEVEHCGADNGTGMRDYIADWCAETFAEMA